ncbi:MAG: S1 RNA-binding domain-containing protein, partial [Pseudomonadota bacterium]
FLPRSQCMSPVKEDDLIYVAVISIENRKKNIIVSIKKVVFEVKKNHQEQLFDLAKAAMDRGDVLWAKITVTNVVDFGLFGKVESVTVKDKNNATVLTVGDLDGCIDGLLHSSEMGWQKDNKTASTKYSAGDVIDLIVKNIDRARNRMHFTMRGLKGNPWMGIADKLTVGQIYKECIVAGVSEGNVVVTIPGVDVEGLIKPSEISWDKHKCDVYQLIMGTKIDVMVIEVNPEEQKLFLSTKKAIDMKNIITLKKKFEANDNVVNGIVRSVSHDAISVELEGGLMGKLLHRNLDWDINKRKIDMYKAGDEIKSKIVRFNEYTEEIELGKKQFEADPLAAEYDRIQVGGKYSCEIYNIEYSNIMVRVNGKLAGFIHYTQLSSDKTQCSTANYKIGQKIDAIVVKIDRDLGIVKMTLIDNTAVEDKKKVEKV